LIKLRLDDFVVPKKTHYGTVMRSTGQDKVYIWNDDTDNWTHCGYLTHNTNVYLPLVGVPQELVPLIADECAKQKSVKVSHVDSVPLEEPVLDSDEEYWSDDE
jgi:hypothetical protein